MYEDIAKAMSRINTHFSFVMDDFNAKVEDVGTSGGKYLLNFFQKAVPNKAVMAEPQWEDEERDRLHKRHIFKAVPVINRSIPVVITEW